MLDRFQKNAFYSTDGWKTKRKTIQKNASVFCKSFCSVFHKVKNDCVFQKRISVVSDLTVLLFQPQSPNVCRIKNSETAKFNWQSLAVNNVSIWCFTDPSPLVTQRGPCFPRYTVLCGAWLFAFKFYSCFIIWLVVLFQPQPAIPFGIYKCFIFIHVILFINNKLF